MSLCQSGVADWYPVCLSLFVAVFSKVGYLRMCVFVFAKVEYQTDQKLHPSATVCLTLDHWAIKSPSVALPLLPLVPYQMEGRVISRREGWMLRTTCICVHCNICIGVQVQEPLFTWNNSVQGWSQVPNSQQVIECKRWNLSPSHPPTHWHLNIKTLSSQSLFQEILVSDPITAWK